MEESWFSKSSAGTKSVEITEDQLEQILDNNFIEVPKRISNTINFEL